MEGTLLLIKKDWIYLSTSIKSALVTSILFCLFMPMSSIGFGIVMPALIGYILTYSVMAYEERSKVELMSAALPVTRGEMCTSRYIESMIYLIGGCIVAQIGIWFNLITQQHMMTREILKIFPTMMTVTFFIGIIYNSFILPVIFYFGTIKARYYLMFSYILIFVGANSVKSIAWIDQSITSYMNKLGDMLWVFMPIIGLNIYYISYRISLQIWKRRDFK